VSAVAKECGAGEVGHGATGGSSEKPQQERRRALILPREHGAWGLLLVPMITGAGVAFRESDHVLPFLL
jgi:hypothetical protein